MTIGDEDLVHWQSWVGRTETREERLDIGAMRRLAAALGESLAVEAEQPSLAHWAFFLPVAPADEIGTDGHPRRGGLLPPVALPRRMFAGSEMEFGQPLLLDEVARRVSTIRGVSVKPGKSGDLVLVEIEHRIEQRDECRVRERQTLVFRDTGVPTLPIVPLAKEEALGEEGEVWLPGPVDLFRFSAATFNSHRIHYDRTYAIAEEGYPDLVVHGPFTAARLFRRAARTGRPSRFAFRAVAPLFVSQPVYIVGDAADGDFAAIRCDGVTAMRATATI